MKYLLDTHEIIWWSDDNQKLKPEFKKIIANPNNTIFVSVASVWEIKIKLKIKKIKLKTNIEKIIKQNNFEILNINLEHVLEVEDLPNYHKDPFDRILIAQSFVEGCQLLTQNKIVRKYILN